MRLKTNLCIGLLLSTMIGLLAGCDFDKAATISIPQAPPQLFVECYLEDGKPPFLLLSMTQGYFESVGLNAVSAGEVFLETPNGIRIDLTPGIYPDFETGKVYNWGNWSPISLRTGEVWKLTAKDTNGRVLTAQSQVMPKILIDSVTYQVRDNDTIAYCAAWLKDPQGVTNYYRMVVNRDSITGGASSTFSFQDNFRDGEQMPIRTGYVLNLYDTAYVRVFSLEPSYYEFVESVEAAQRNNGNPFAQPNTLKTAVKGGLGIFTTLVFDKRKFVLNQRKGKIL